MTLLQYAAILALLGISIIKPFLYRPLAEKYPANFAPEFTVAWIMPFILLSLPFMYPYLIDAVPTIKAHPTSFVLTILKGVLIWYAYKYAQIINHDSTSSTVFFPFISLATASLTINLFFHENLAPTHIRERLTLLLLYSFLPFVPSLTISPLPTSGAIHTFLYPTLQCLYLLFLPV